MAMAELTEVYCRFTSVRHHTNGTLERELSFIRKSSWSRAVNLGRAEYAKT